MTEAERDELNARLSDFSGCLDAKVRELKEWGEFTNTHRALIEEIARRQSQVQKKIALAEANDTAWNLIKNEMQRDFSSLFDTLLQFNEQLDVDQVKAQCITPRFVRAASHMPLGRESHLR